MRGTGRRRPKESFNPPPPPTPQFRRDSDASFASSRPSSIGMARPAAVSVDIYKDRALQSAAVNTINSALKELFSHSFNVTFKPSSPPSLKDLTETIRLLLQCLDYQPTKLEDDLPIVLKALGYPFKINKGILKSPPAPHQWYPILALLHWLVQAAVCNTNLQNDSESDSFVTSNDVNIYALNSYVHYIRGDDDSVEALDQEFLERLEKGRDEAVESFKGLEEEVKELEAKAEALRSGPSQREVLKKQQSLLEEDVKKFHTMISGYSEKMQELKKSLEDKEKVLEVKVLENKRICEENEELKIRVESQMFNPRDMERMRRELQAVERDILEAEVSRDTWDAKTLDLDEPLKHKFKEIEAMAMDCNQAVRRLKLDNCHQYILNANGSTPADVMGIDYKTTIKPALDSFAEDIKKSSMTKLEDLISLRQQSSKNTAEIESRRNDIASLQSDIDEVETEVNSLKKEIRDYTLRCSIESKKMVEEVQQEAHNLNLMEKEAGEILKNAKLKHQETIKQGEEEIELCARELFACVESVSKYQEFARSKISDMKSNLSKTAVDIAEAYKNSLPAELGSVLGKNMGSSQVLNLY